MPTVIDPRMTQAPEQGQDNTFQAVLSQLNQQRHEVEKQQRQYEYNTISKYVADHGGWANVLTQPGGEEMYKSFATNTLGYTPDVAEKAKTAIKQGYNPEEALYRINQELQFSGGQAPSAGGQRQEQQTDGTLPPGGGFDPTAVSSMVQQPEQQQGPTREAARGSGYTGSGVAGDPVTQGYQGLRDTARQARGSYAVTGSLDEETQGDNPAARSSIAGAQWQQQREEKAAEKQRKSQDEFDKVVEKNIESTEGKEEGAVPPIQQQVKENVHELTNNVVSLNRNLFPGGNVPVWDKMNQKQKDAYSSVQSYFEDVKQGQSLDQVISGAREVFNTIGTRPSEKDKPLSEGKKKAAAQQIKNKSMKVARDLQAPETLGEFAEMSKDQVRQFRAKIDWMQENDPQRWAETYGSAMKAAKDLSDKRYKDALTVAQQVRTGLNQLKLKMQQQAMEGDAKAAQMDTIITLAETFMKNPDLAKRPEFKDTAEAVGAFTSNMISSMVGASDGDRKSIMKRMSTKNSGLFGWWGDNQLEAVFMNPEGTAGEGGQEMSPAQREILRQYLRNQ